MADTGAISPGTMADDNAIGTITWTNPNNAKASDNTYVTASSVPAGVYTHYLKATNFGFSIPGGATIDGILVEIERKAAEGNSMIDSEVKIVKSDASIGTENKASGTYYPTSDTYASYGANSDLWGEIWASTDINNANFGVVLSTYMDDWADDGIPYIDHIRITVYYTEAAPAGTNQWLNIDDTWRQLSEAWVNVDDSWRKVKEAWINVDDVWRKLYSV